MEQDSMSWWRRLFHKHVWRDGFVFDSAFEMHIPSGETRVIGRAVMMHCTLCGAMKRRPLTRAARTSPSADSAT
jgi:hypothetical protein